MILVSAKEDRGEVITPVINTEECVSGYQDGIYEAEQESEWAVHSEMCREVDAFYHQFVLVSDLEKGLEAIPFAK